MAAVTFRLLSVESQAGLLQGICLCFESESEAKAAFEHLHEYLITPQTIYKLLNVTFRKTGTSYRLDILVHVGDLTFQISILAINPDYVTALRDCLAHHRYVFITAGFPDPPGTAELRLLPFADYHMFISTVDFDGELVEGSRDSEYPVDELTQSDQ